MSKKDFPICTKVKIQKFHSPFAPFISDEKFDRQQENEKFGKESY